MRVTRRDLLRAAAASGGLLLARPTGALAVALPSIDRYGTPRASRLVPGSWVVHTDMHNHSQFSDGAGDPDTFYDVIRSSGIDAAALTDHTTISDTLEVSPCHGPFAAPEGESSDCQGLAGLNEVTWRRTRELADAANRDGTFAAVRGFEWSSPTLGHVNAWFTEEFTDPLHTAGLGTPDELARYAESEGLPTPPGLIESLSDTVDATPAGDVSMRPWYEWLKAVPATPGIGGGADGIFGFNHPGREPARFSEFAFDPALVDRCVSLELFNRDEDYLFERVDDGRDSPLVACLDAGWRPGILGVSDYHGTDWGFPEGRGRAGMWVDRLDRGALREAMEARRFYATNLKGLRLDATANGARMGATLGHTAGPVTFLLDIDRGPAWYGRTLVVQVLQTGSPLPTVVHQAEVRVPAPDEPVLVIDAPIDVVDGDWVVLRVTDPEVAPDGRATGEYAAVGAAVAYASPWYLDPDAAPPAPTEPGPGTDPAPIPDASGPSLPTTGGVGGWAGLAALGVGGLLHVRRGRDGHAHDVGHDGHPHDVRHDGHAQR